MTINTVKLLSLDLGLLNFEEAYAALLDANACIKVMNGEELTRRAASFLGDAKACKDLNARAKEAVESMRGALDVSTKAVLDYLPAKQNVKKERRRAS